MVKKQISFEKGLQARGLFALAHENYKRANQAIEALADLLGYDSQNYCGCISDQAVEGGDFDKGMKDEGFVILHRPSKPRKK